MGKDVDACKEVRSGIEHAHGHKHLHVGMLGRLSIVAMCLKLPSCPLVSFCRPGSRTSTPATPPAPPSSTPSAAATLRPPWRLPPPPPPSPRECAAAAVDWLPLLPLQPLPPFMGATAVLWTMGAASIPVLPCCGAQLQTFHSGCTTACLPRSNATELDMACVEACMETEGWSPVSFGRSSMRSRRGRKLLARCACLRPSNQYRSTQHTFAGVRGQ